ncbi:unnamed protein product [Withania somnifera]
METCKKEINDLLSKRIIRPSKSPWSCSAFYVNNTAKKERGAPRLVINYKPLNKVLKWIRAIEFSTKFPDIILEKTQLQRFLGCLNYVANFIPNIRIICEPLYKCLGNNPVPWSEKQTRAIRNIKKIVQKLPCLGIPNPTAFMIKNYSTVKKEILSIVLCITKFQDDLINKEFLLRVDCKSAKEILQKDVKNLISKQIFARWKKSSGAQAPPKPLTILGKVPPLGNPFKNTIRPELKHENKFSALRPLFGQVILKPAIRKKQDYAMKVPETFAKAVSPSTPVKKETVPNLS